MRKSIITLGIILAGAGSFGALSRVHAAADTTGEIHVSAAEILRDGYSGPVDPITGEPLEGDDGEAMEQVEIQTTDGSYYNRNEDRYTYFSDYGKVECGVADGMIVTGEVEVKVEGSSGIALYKDGNKVDKIPEVISDAGSYMFIAGDANNKSQLVGFRIVKKTTGVLNQYVMPDGFYIDSVTVDGTERNSGFKSVDMNEEGYYEINYTNSVTQVGYSLKVTVDHTPPQVTFKGVDKKNKAKGPVTIKGLEDDDIVTVTYNGKKYSLNMDNKLTESGRYKVVVTDQAGNRVEKTFTILIYLNLSSTLFIAIILAIIIGVCIALYITRKRLRVR